MLFFIIVFGLIVGSFINALVWRLSVVGKNKYRDVNTSILSGRSLCPSCKHELSYKDLVPVISWLYLRGRCRYCSAIIGTIYPLVELVTSVLFVTSFLNWMYSFDAKGIILFIIWLLILTVLISLAVYDYLYMILPNVLVYISVILSLTFIAGEYSFYNSNITFLVSRLLGIAFSSGIFYVLYQISSGKWIGGGDVKLCISLGLILGGPLNVLLMIFIASLLGCLYVFISIFFSKAKFHKKNTIPFGPLLIFSTFICFFYSNHVLDIMHM